MPERTAQHTGGKEGAVELRRVDRMPPYVFGQVNDLKLRARRAGEDIIDLGFGNPDIPSPPAAVEKLTEAARNPRNHRYSSSRGIPNLRKAVCDRYRRRFGVELDPETEAITTIGAKEGLAHLMWTLAQPGDLTLVPEPSYPIHLYAAALAGSDVHRVPVSDAAAFLEGVERAFQGSGPAPRVILASFPHNPTTVCVDLDFMTRLVELARRYGAFLVHDFAYADVAFDGYRPPSILEAPGARERAVELYTLTKGHSMAGWRVGFTVGNARVVDALARLKSYLDYGTFQPIQIASIVALNEGDQYVTEVNSIYERRRNTLVDGLNRNGWKVEKPAGTMFVWAKIPEPYHEMGSMDFTIYLLEKAKVAVSPGVGFGEAGEGYVRFALVENDHRTAQAVRGIRSALDRL